MRSLSAGGPRTVSVVIPTFNRAAQTLEAARSVLAQSSAPLELLIVDDGSLDSTLSRLAELLPSAPVRSAPVGARPSQRIRLVSSPNRGVSAARNEGIRRSQGTWIAFLDSDDTWLPEKLAAQLEALAEQPDMRVVHCDEIWIRGGRRVNPRRVHRKYGGWIYRHCLPRCAISPSSVMLHRAVFDQVGLFDEDLPACEDYDLWLRVCSRMPVLYVDRKLVRKTGGHADQLSRLPALDRYRIEALAKILDSGTLGPEDRAATVEMLRQKIDVYLPGVRKRGRDAEARRLEALRRRLVD